MRYAPVIIALLCLYLSSCTSEWTGNCEGPFFADGNTSFPDKVTETHYKLGGADFDIATKYEAELTDVVLEVTFPKEIKLKPKLVYETNEVVDFANRKVIRKIDRMSGDTRESTGCAIEYDIDKWCKPIEVFRKVYFRQRVTCDISQNMPEGIYIKRTFFYAKNGRLVVTADSDKYWIFVGGPEQYAIPKSEKACK